MKARFEALRSEQSGFTLIELLIVIVILGILATVVIFGVANFRSNAEQNACDTTQATVNTAGRPHLSSTNPTATAPIPGAVSRWLGSQHSFTRLPAVVPATTYGSLHHHFGC